jgi:type IV pilus assembly protein PilM
VAFFRSNKPRGLVGLDIGSSSVKAVELNKKGNGYELAGLGLDPLSQDTIVDGAIMDAPSVSSTIGKVFEDSGIQNPNVAASVSGHSVIVKRITVSALNQSELEQAIQQEAQQHIRFDLADVNLTYYPLGGAGAGSAVDVLLLAVKREKMESHANVVALANKTLMVLDIDAFALQNAFEVNYEPAADLTVALLNVGASSMNINITRGGAPLFTRDVSVGGNQYTDILQKELDLSFEDAEKLKMGEKISTVKPGTEETHLRSVSELLLLEIQKTFDFFRQTNPNDHIGAIYLSGGTAQVKGLVNLLQEDFRVPVEILNPFHKISINSSRFDSDFISAIAPRMTVSVGLALRSFDEV